MRLRELKKGTEIDGSLTIDAPLDSHNGIATYLASNHECGHILLHIFPDFEDKSFEKLEKSAAFHRDVLGVEVQYGRFEEFLYFSEPFPLGEFLFEWLEKREHMELADAVKHVLDGLHTLQEAHERGICHGRITPKSVLMERTGDDFVLRLMGLGISPSLTESMRLDIDWSDYTFDLEGMTPQAVDIYGMGIILMGLVCGERGIDSFEATGLLPQVFRGGMLQQAMERALALRIDAYQDALAFRLDLEAALLEIDAKQGEVYVGDLVGFESAIKSIAGISHENQAITENSGVWNSLVATLEQEERSSLLCSLTSLTSVKAVEGGDEEDDDVTCVTTVPKAVLGLRRIKSGHTNMESGDAENEHTHVVSRAIVGVKSEESEILKEDEPETDPRNHDERAPSPNCETLPRLPSGQKLAVIQSLEQDLQASGMGDEEDESPTRVIKRPNYFSISFEQHQPGVSSSIEAVLQASNDTLSDLDKMKKRVTQAEIVQKIHELGHDTVDGACDDETSSEQSLQNSDNDLPKQQDAENKPADTAIESQVSSRNKLPHVACVKKNRRRVVIALLMVVAILLVIAVIRSMG